MHQPSDTSPLGIIGGGGQAQALACHFRQLGLPVWLWTRTPHKIAKVYQSRSIQAVGKMEGCFSLQATCTDLADLTRNCTNLFVATPASAHAEVARTLAPHLRAHHHVVLVPGKFCGTLEFSEVLKREGATPVPVVETDGIFASRLKEDGTVWVRGIKAWCSYSAGKRSLTHQEGWILRQYFPDFEPADNVIARGLAELGALAHPLTVIANMNCVDRGKPFLFYWEGFTERTIRIMEVLEREYARIAAAYDTMLIPYAPLLDRQYGCQNTSLLEAIRSVPNYEFSWAPDTLDHRYLYEEVPCTLVPLSQLARLAGVETPILDAVIAFSSVLSGQDFRTQGRSLEKLGWGGLSCDQIRQWLKD